MISAKEAKKIAQDFNKHNGIDFDFIARLSGIIEKQAKRGYFNLKIKFCKPCDGDAVPTVIDYLLYHGYKIRYDTNTQKFDVSWE